MNQANRKLPYQEWVVELYTSPATSYWLRGAIDALELRDPLDARRDAELLAALQARRVDELQP